MGMPVADTHAVTVTITNVDEPGVVTLAVSDGNALEINDTVTAIALRR